MKPLSFPARRFELFCFLLVLAIAAIARLGWPGLTEFKADEARLLALAYDMAGGQFAFRGISSSVGFPNFPMSVWLYALPSLLWQHPYAATLFTGLLNTLAVAGCYWFVRRYWGVPAALAAALLLAVSPWPIIFSRKIWAQNLLPLFVMGWAGSATLALVERKSRLLWLHFLCLAVAVQIHLATAALVPATAVFLAAFWRRVDWRQVGLGMLAGGATAVPFLIYLWQNRGAASLPVLLSGSGSQAVVNLESFRLTVLLSLGVEIHSLAGPVAYERYLGQLPPGLGSIAYALWAILIMGGMALAVHNAIRYRRVSAATAPHAFLTRVQAEAGFVVLVWLLLPPLFFLRQSTPIFIHYFIPTLPAQYILAGVFAGWLGTHRLQITRYHFLPAIHRLPFAVTWIFLLATAVYHLTAWGTLLRLLGREATPGGFGMPLAMQLQAVSEVQHLVGETHAAEVLLGGAGETPDLDEFPAVFHTLLRDLPHRFVDGRRSALFPAQAAVVLLQNDPAVQELGQVYLGQASQAAAVPLRRGEGELLIVAIPGQAAPNLDVLFSETYLFSNWVTLLGYRWQAAEETAVYDLTWQTGANPDPERYHFFNHLLDEQGRRIAQDDAPAFAPWQWRAGDVVISRFQLTWQETAVPALLRTGMYRYPSVEPVLLLDVAGNPYADAAEIRLRE